MIMIRGKLHTMNAAKAISQEAVKNRGREERLPLFKLHKAMKQELRKRFDHFTCFEWLYPDAHLIKDKYMNDVFDFFYSEIEARASRIKALEERLDIALKALNNKP